MPATYEPIASTTLGSAAGTITFSNLPGTYTDIVGVVSYATSIADYSPGLRFNGDDAGNYSATRIIGNGSTASSSRQSNTTFIYTTQYGVTKSTSSPIALAIFQVMNYANASVFKTVLSLGSGEGTGNGTDRTVGLWRSTSAITSITLFGAPSGNFVAGTTASLYGIKAA